MKATIHHNPMCGTSRKTLEILQDSGADLTVTEYLKNPAEQGRAEAPLRPRRNFARATASAPRNLWRRSLG